MAILQLSKLTMIATNSKKVIGITLIALVWLSISSCCTKKYCLGVEDMDEIWFYNFANNALDTIVIKRFSKNTNFSTVVDSSTTITNYFSSSKSPQIIRLTSNLTVDFDYKVEIISTGQSFKISDFVVKKERCNTGFLCNDYFNALHNYKVNGQTRSDRTLTINN